MSSGFVSGGTVDRPAERDDEWRKAQQELEETRRRKEDESRQEDGKSLYEVLQANKAAKQDAFEESIRLKNQFRNLDEDEVEFLDSVLESTRAREEAVKKETREQLELFRRQQEEADRALMAERAEKGDATEVGGSGSPTAEESLWTVKTRKKRRLKEKETTKFTKHRKLSSPLENPESAVTKPSFLEPTNPRGKLATISSINCQGTASLVGSPAKAVDPSKRTIDTAAIDATGGKLNTQETKPNLLNLALGSYDSDNDD